MSLFFGTNKVEMVRKENFSHERMLAQSCADAYEICDIWVSLQDSIERNLILTSHFA